MPLYRAELLAKKPLRYAALIHDVSQVLYLPFDWDDGSYARDRSGYGNHGTIYGATLATGKIGMARRFDGVDDYVEVPHSPSLDVKKFTLAGWFNFANVDTRQILIAKFLTKATFELAYRGDLTPKQIHFAFVDATGAVALLMVDYAFEAGKWYYLAATYDQAQMKLLVNGAEIASKAETKIPVSTTDPVYIGIRKGYEFPFNGFADSPRLCNRALSQDEIRMLMYRRLV